MNQSKFFRRLRTVDALVVAFSLVGCISIGGKKDHDSGGGGDECADDFDCNNGQVCADGECVPEGSGGSAGSVAGGSGGTSGATAGKGGAYVTGGTSGASTGGVAGSAGASGAGGACGWFCSWAAVCGGDTDGTCRAGCDASYAMGGACRTAIDQLGQCVRTNTACDSISSACATPADAVLTNCDSGGTTCPYTNDLECDEPEGTGLCAEGTDVNDCRVGGTCPYTNDLECDEPEGTGLCAEGTDVNDCAAGGSCIEGSSGNTCVWACDAECDEAAGTGLCSAGTDTWDCAHYP